MKIFRILGFDVRFFFSVRKVKRLTFNLPDWADDTCIANVDDKPIIKYYKGTTRYYIDLPKCSDAVAVSLTPMSGIINGVKTKLTDRKIVVDVFS